MVRNSTITDRLIRICYGNKPDTLNLLCFVPATTLWGMSKKRIFSLSVLAAFAAIYLIWGSTFAAIRLVVEHLPPLSMGGARFTVAGGLLLLFLVLRGERLPRAGLLIGPAVTGALMLTGSHGLVGWAQQWVPSGLAAVMLATGPLWIVLLGWLAFSERRPSLAVAASLVLGLGGVWIIAAPGGGLPTVPALLLAVAPVLWSTGALLSTRLPRPDSTLMSTALQMLTGGAGLLALGVARGELAILDRLPTVATPWVALAYLTVLGSLVALVSYQWLLREVGPAATSTHAFVNPVVALLIGGLALGEPLPPAAALGGGMVLLAVLLNLRDMLRRDRLPATSGVRSEPTAGVPTCSCGPRPCR